MLMRTGHRSTVCNKSSVNVVVRNPDVAYQQYYQGTLRAGVDLYSSNFGRFDTRPSHLVNIFVAGDYGVSARIDLEPAF
jgi:hypothetical protein